MSIKYRVQGYKDEILLQGRIFSGQMQIIRNGEPIGVIRRDFSLIRDAFILETDLEEEVPFLRPERLLPVGKREDVDAHAKALFARLREADGTNAEIIYAHLPDKSGLGLALYNRMIRAAAHTIRKVSHTEQIQLKNIEIG